MKTYKAYREAGLSRFVAAKGQWHSFKLWVKYLPSEIKNWWFWNVHLPALKRRDPEEFKAAMERMKEAIDKLK